MISKKEKIVLAVIESRRTGIELIRICWCGNRHMGLLPRTNKKLGGNVVYQTA
jgi:hypothetical protein